MIMTTPENITIIGDGAMGTVCSLILAQKECPVRLWGYSAQQIVGFAAAGENTRFLPGFKFPPGVKLTAGDAEAFAGASLVISAIPCKFLRGVWTRLKPHLPAENLPILSVTKGIENETLARPTEIIAAVTGPRPIAAFSGPNIAEELARGLPATSTVASADQTLAARVQRLFSTGWFRIYTNSDLIGVELAGATKNVIAIAGGILDGLRAGDNAKAALLTRGLVEITRLGTALGASPETFTGLSGMGDLITTCYSPVGRNRSFGQAVGAGASVAQALAAIPGEVEGVNTCRSVVALARREKVEMPITEGIYQILFEAKPVARTIQELMSRRLKSE